MSDVCLVYVLQLRPLYELVKELPCSGLKRFYLKQALEQFLSEQDRCHCRPCRNNGTPLVSGSECHCVCRPGTSGPACEIGIETGAQLGGTGPNQNLTRTRPGLN